MIVRLTWRATKRRSPAGRIFLPNFDFLHADGSYRRLIDTGLVALDDAGQIQGFIGSCVDVTVLAVAEAELRRHR